MNKEPPDVTFRKKDKGGLNYQEMVPQSSMTQQTCLQILREYKIHNADVILKQDVTVDEFIDVVEGNRKYMPCLYVMNKIDQLTIEVCWWKGAHLSWFVFWSDTLPFSFRNWISSLSSPITFLSARSTDGIWMS